MSAFSVSCIPGTRSRTARRAALQTTVCAALCTVAAGALAQEASAPAPTLSRVAQILYESQPQAVRAQLKQSVAHRAADTPLTRSCAFILGDGTHLYDEKRVMDTSFHSLRFREWICQSGFRNKAQLTDAATALDLADPDMGSMFGYLLKDDPAAFARQLGQFCATGYELHVNPAARENFQRQARAAMTDAYRTCLATSAAVATGPSGSVTWITPQDKDLRHFTVNLRWPAAGGRITPVAISNASCDQPVGRELRARGEQLSFSCTRNGEQSGVLTLRTASGEETLILPGQLDTAMLRLEDRLTILRDRVQLLERGLDKLAPETLSELRDADRNP